MRVRRTLEPILRDLFEQYPVVTVTGPRQSGKTTLCRSAFPDLEYVNLEAPDVREFANEDPRGFLAARVDGAILDEIQRAPELLSFIQPLIDAEGRNSRFVLTGSQHFGMTQAVSQSLAGRTAVLQLLPFSMSELGQLDASLHPHDLIFSGFYPRIHDRHLDPTSALGAYTQTYVERDVRQVMEIRNLPEFQRFVRLCAGRVGQLLNFSNLANDAGVTHTTVRQWIGVLEASYISFRLPPYHANLRKRLIKAPKFYFVDVGLATYLLGIERPEQVLTHPLRGALFENLIVAEALKFRYHRGKPTNLFFYRERGGREVDLIYTVADRLAGIEIKAGETLTADYFRSLNDLRALLGDRVLASILVYGGTESGERSGARFMGATRFERALEALSSGAVGTE